MLNYLLNLIFTNHCLLCSNLSFEKISIFCLSCLLFIKKKTILNKKICIKCSNPLKENFCLDCDLRNKNMQIYFDKNYSCFLFSKEIKKILNYAKFLNKEYIFYHLGHLMALLFDSFLEKKFFIIIPVPISKKRLLFRGFNPSYILAKVLSKNLNIPIFSNVLLKFFDNATQSKLSYKKRLMNPYNKYSIVNKELIYNKNIYLLDDIFTTGSTINECSRILKNAGANQVISITFSKTLFS